MSRARTILAISLLLAAVAAPVRAAEPAEATLETLVETLRSNKKALVAANLQLDATEAAAFWPVYDRYQAELETVQERLAQVIQDYTASFATMTDAKALELVDTLLAAEVDRAKIRQSYRDPFSKALPGRKVMRFYQIENKADAVLRFELAKTIPVIGQ
jgi:hypothetical protein